MDRTMFCFQCEQTAGCTGCTGKAGVCGKTSDVAKLQDELTGQIYPVNNVFISIINNAMIENERGEYSVTEPFFNPHRGILWKNNVCKLRAHFRTDDKNIKVLKSLKGVDITPEVPEE